MTKTGLIAKAAGLGLEVEDKDTKEMLLEKIATFLSEEERTEDLTEFLEENGFTLNEEGEVVKKTKRGTLGENPNTKAYHTIQALQNEELAGLTYPELAKYIKETEGVETTANSIAWYANWLKSKGKPVVARQKAKKEAAPEEAAQEDTPEEV
jgi:CO dehydrogenase/acetyl-CoA synthase beta subunit